jgi:hypothetical protein
MMANLNKLIEYFSGARMYLAIAIALLAYGELYEATAGTVVAATICFFFYFLARIDESIRALGGGK